MPPNYQSEGVAASCRLGPATGKKLTVGALATESYGKTGAVTVTLDGDGLSVVSEGRSRGDYSGIEG